MEVDKKLRKIRITLIRSELYNYSLTKKELENLKKLADNNKSEEIFQTTVNFLTNIQINHAISWINAIEWALTSIESTSNGQTKIKMINYKYFSASLSTDEGLAFKCHIHVNTLRNWDLEFIKLIASRIGLKV